MNLFDFRFYLLIFSSFKVNSTIFFLLKFNEFNSNIIN